MEPFLNLCWLALAVPAYVLWRRRIGSGHSAPSSRVIVGTLACSFVLLFPVISASDDLHATSQAIEESKRSFGHGAPHAGSSHGVAHESPFLVPASASLTAVFEQLGSARVLALSLSAAPSASVSAGRSPPLPPVAL